MNRCVLTAALIALSCGTLFGQSTIPHFDLYWVTASDSGQVEVDLCTTLELQYGAQKIQGISSTPGRTPLSAAAIDDQFLVVAWKETLGFSVELFLITSGGLTSVETISLGPPEVVNFLSIEFEPLLGRFVYFDADRLDNHGEVMQSSTYTPGNLLSGLTWSPLGVPADFFTLRGRDMFCELAWRPLEINGQIVNRLSAEGVAQRDEIGVTLLPDTTTQDYGFFEANDASFYAAQAFIEASTAIDGSNSITISGPPSSQFQLQRGTNLTTHSIPAGSQEIKVALPSDLEVGERLQTRSMSGELLDQLTVSVLYPNSSIGQYAAFSSMPFPPDAFVGNMDFLVRVELAVSPAPGQDVVVDGFGLAGLAQRINGVDPVSYSAIDNAWTLDHSSSLAIPIVGHVNRDGLGFMQFSMPIGADPTLAGLVFLTQFAVMDGPNAWVFSDVIGMKVQSAP